jgi:hypothetical protein
MGMADALANNVLFSFPPEGEPRAIVGVKFKLAPPDLPPEVSQMLARVLARVPWTLSTEPRTSRPCGTP